jgi:aspartate dehydrogenase
MKDRIKIGIVGCGAIGSSLAKTIVKDFSRQAQLAALYDIDEAKAKRLSRVVSKKKNLFFGLKQLISKSGLVIEAASAKSSWAIARAVLSAGRDIMIMSVGGVVDRAEGLERLARKYKAKVYIPSGAISGIDALKASGIGKIKKVVITTSKHPFSFKGVEYVRAKGIKLDKIKQDKVLFSGSARQAVKYFPQNINVAAVLSLAGIGSRKTQVKIIASLKAKRNTHEIQIDSDSGRIFTRTENVLHPDNPKTSYLAVLSAVATLKRIVRPVVIGT